jgi:dTDP-4-amino-4,6-dideoxygalactose transaminase
MNPSFNYLAIFIDSPFSPNMRDLVMNELENHGVDARKFFSPPAYKHPAYKGYISKGFRLKVSEKLASQCLALPIYPGMSYRNITKICQIIKRFLKRAQT